MKKDVTRKRLADALVEVSAKKPIDKIRIREICAVAGLSCQTFYNHFNDKYDLILWIHKSYGDELIKKLDNREITFRELHKLNLQFYLDNSDFMVNALYNTHGNDSYLIKSSENAVEVLKGHISRKLGIDELPFSDMVALRMYVYGCIEVYAFFAISESCKDIDEMVDIVMEGMPMPLKRYLL